MSKKHFLIIGLQPSCDSNIAARPGPRPRLALEYYARPRPIVTKLPMHDQDQHQNQFHSCKVKTCTCSSLSTIVGCILFISLKQMYCCIKHLMPKRSYGPIYLHCCLFHFDIQVSNGRIIPYH